MASELHVYQCWVCKTTLTSTVTSAGTGAPFRCVLDRTPMTFVCSYPVTTDADRALAARGTVYNAHAERRPVNTKRQCNECLRWVEKADLIQLGAGGKYCSERCADAGTEKHRAVMERTEKLYEKKPWLRPRAKETA